MELKITIEAGELTKALLALSKSLDDYNSTARVEVTQEQPDAAFSSEEKSFPNVIPDKVETATTVSEYICAQRCAELDKLTHCTSFTDAGECPYGNQPIWTELRKPKADAELTAATAESVVPEEPKKKRVRKKKEAEPVEAVDDVPEGQIGLEELAKAEPVEDLAPEPADITEASVEKCAGQVKQGTANALSFINRDWSNVNQHGKRFVELKKGQEDHLLLIQLNGLWTIQADDAFIAQEALGLVGWFDNTTKIPSQADYSLMQIRYSDTLTNVPLLSFPESLFSATIEKLEACGYRVFIVPENVKPNKAPAVPVSEPTYSFDQIQKAVAEMCRDGKQAEMREAMTSLGYSRTPDIPKDKYPLFVKAIREKGAAI